MGASLVLMEVDLYYLLADAWLRREHVERLPTDFVGYKTNKMGIRDLFSASESMARPTLTACFFHQSRRRPDCGLQFSDVSIRQLRSGIVASKQLAVCNVCVFVPARHVHVWDDKPRLAASQDQGTR